MRGSHRLCHSAISVSKIVVFVTCIYNVMQSCRGHSQLTIAAFYFPANLHIIIEHGNSGLFNHSCLLRLDLSIYIPKAYTHSAFLQFVFCPSVNYVGTLSVQMFIWSLALNKNKSSNFMIFFGRFFSKTSITLASIKGFPYWGLRPFKNILCA